MIKALQLKNFQGHPNTNIELTPGVNIITGMSDAGKSSIIRALYWLLHNRPGGAGDNYRYHNAPKKERTSVTVELDNGQVCRFKRGTLNGYSTTQDGIENEYVAIRSDVPEEVASILQMEDHNTQLQHNGYFLINETAGQVAQRLNSIAGLELIDVCLKNANSMAASNQQKINNHKERTEELDELLVPFADMADKALAVIELEGLNKEVQELNGVVEYMENAIGQIASTREQADKLAEFLTIQEVLEELDSMAKDIANMDDNINFLAVTINTGMSLQQGCKALDAEVKSLEIEFQTLLRESGTCPLCLQLIKEK